MIRAYPSDATVDGTTLRLHVATDAERFAVRFYRQGAHFEALEMPLVWFAGRNAAARECGVRWEWPSYALELPPAWPSGAYVAQCVESDHEPALQGPDARANAALFVVRRRPRKTLLVNLPLFTYHAYNGADVDGTQGVEAACLYSGHRAVSLHRPGGGTGGHPWDAFNPDAYDCSSPRQTFAHWDAKALAWLAAAGYAFDVCTDVDLHRGRLAREVRLLALFGHQEYWTAPMRRTVERFLARGGNVAFFSGNTAWFRVRYDAARAAIVRDGRWCDDEPEEALSGLSYRFGGGVWRGLRPPSGYVVADASHWVFAGTRLRGGDCFGAAARLVGYECDGPNPASSVRPLARAPLDDWKPRVAPRGDGDANGEVLGEAAAIVTFERASGTVFNAGTVDWPRVLVNGEPAVDRITRNVIDRLS